MKRLLSRHRYFILITGYIASYCFLMTITLATDFFDAQSEWTYLWASPVIAVLIFLVLAFMYYPLGIIFAGLLVLCQRIRIFPAPFLLSAVMAAVIVLLTNHGLPFTLIDTPSPSLDPRHIVDLSAISVLTIIGWIALVIFQRRHPAPAKPRVTQRLEPAILLNTQDDLT